MRRRVACEAFDSTSPRCATRIPTVYAADLAWLLAHVEVFKECNSSVVSDSNKCTNETFSGKEQCIKLLGCTWTDNDGTASQNADLGGTCSGEPLPCAELPRNNCREAAGCEYKPTAMVCERESPPLPAQCSTYSPATTGEGSSRHPSTARGICLSVLGCSFTRTDGTSEAAKPL